MYVTQIEEKRRAKFVGKNYRKEENKEKKEKENDVTYLLPSILSNTSKSFTYTRQI